jgi:hypothetical protein
MPLSGSLMPMHGWETPVRYDDVTTQTSRDV